MRQHTTRRATAALAAALMTALALALAPAAGADTDIPLPFTETREVAVDPGTGRVFVSGGDGVAAYQPDGTLITTITDIPGAWGMDATQGAIWVNESSTQTIAKIDPSNLTVTKRYDVGLPLHDDLTIVGTAAWFGQWGPDSGLGRFDLTTSTSQIVGTDYAPATARLGASTDDLLVWNRGIYNGTIFRRSTTAPFEIAASGTLNGSGRVATSSADGSKVWTTADWSAFQEYDGATLANTGVKHQAVGGASQIAWSSAHGGILVGVADSSVVVFEAGTSAPIAKIPVSGIYRADDLGVSPDGDTAYVLAQVDDGSHRMQTFDLRPSIAGRSPATVVAAAPAEATVTGRGLGGTTQVVVGGIAVEPSTTTPDRVTFTTPAGLAPGVHTVVLEGPTGSPSTSISVTASTGAALDGTVRIGTSPGPGVSLTLSGGSLTAPRTATTDTDGRYSFTALAAGAGYSLTVHDPAASAPDQVVRNIGLLPNATETVDIDLSRPRPDGADLARTSLGSATVRDLIVDPTSGKVVIAAGDEVDVVDGDGRLLARIRGMYGVRSLSQEGTDVYVGLGDAARIVRISLPTASVTGSWAVGRKTTGSIAASGGKVWFVDGDDQWTRLRSLDPATGAIGAPSTKQHYVPFLRRVTGSPDRFLASELNDTTLVDGSSTAATPVKATAIGSDQKPLPPLTATTATGRIYDSTGRRFRLSDLVADGVRYPGSGPPAYTAGHGGLVATGGTVATETGAVATHEFDGSWTGTGLSPDGVRLYTTLGDELRVHDLAPHVDATGPEPLYSGRTLIIDGTGLGVVQQVTVDGALVPFDVIDPGQIEVGIGSVAPGIRRVAITTPWGTSAAAPVRVAAPRAPQAPTDVTATPGATGITIGWAAPTDDGGKAITGYAVTATPGGATCTTTGARTCAFTSLTPGAWYTFAVTATSSQGTSAASPSTDPVRVPVLPSAPHSVTATAGGNSTDVRWYGPDDAGGLPILRFRICASTNPAVPSDSATCTETANSSASGTVGGLTAGSAYHVTVAAITAKGRGPASTPAGPVVPFTTPGAPTALVATPGATTVTLSWTAPAQNGGSPITSYKVCRGSAAPFDWCLSVWPLATSLVLPDDQGGGTTHPFAVVAGNAAGFGSPSAPLAVTFPLLAPRPPMRPSVARGDRSIEVTWSPPYDGGSPITGYRVCTSADPAMAGSTCTEVGVTTHTTIAGLPVGVARYATVAAINAVGTGKPSSVSDPATPVTTPGAPTAVTAIPNVGTAIVEWTAPSTDGGAPVSGYVVTPYIGAEPQAATTFSTTTTMQVITGLQRGVGYSFEVRARNDAGAGAPARSATVTTLGAGSPAPFASLDVFVARQLTDFTGSAGTEHSRASTVAKLAAGTLTPAAFVEGLLDHPWQSQAVAPTTRLYWAYFGRIPDHGGLEYWSGKRRRGTTLIRISASFAGSREFTRTYGSLSNTAFVDLVYRNVLGRPADPGGRSFWVAKLNKGMSRGQVMVNFSESGEYVRKTTGKVGVVEVHAAMLDRSPTSAELGIWQDESVRSLVDAIRLGDEYAEHVS